MMEIRRCAACGKDLDGIETAMIVSIGGGYIVCNFDCEEELKKRCWKDDPRNPANQFTPEGGER